MRYCLIGSKIQWQVAISYQSSTTLWAKDWGFLMIKNKLVCDEVGGARGGGLT